MFASLQIVNMVVCSGQLYVQFFKYLEFGNVVLTNLRVGGFKFSFFISIAGIRCT